MASQLWWAVEMCLAEVVDRLALCLQVILFDPQYDAYKSMAERCGAVVQSVKLNVDDDWSVPQAELAAAFSDRTKLVLVNTPHNPTGKVFSREDLQCIADL